MYDHIIDISEGIYNAKSNSSKECVICHYWFYNHGFYSQDYVCNGCHDLTVLSTNISNIVIITIKNVDYRCIIHNISKSEAINLLKDSILEDRGYTLRKFVRFPSKIKGKNQERFAMLWRNGYDCSISESRIHGERRPFGGKGC